jgi:uncharacterized membrane protein
MHYTYDIDEGFRVMIEALWCSLCEKQIVEKGTVRGAVCECSSK